MNRTYIANELLKAAREVTARSRVSSVTIKKVTKSGDQSLMGGYDDEMLAEARKTMSEAQSMQAKLPEAKEYREGVEDMRKAFTSFSRLYIKALEKMVQNKKANLLLMGKKARGQRDDIADAWQNLNYAINTHDIFTSRTFR